MSTILEWMRYLNDTKQYIERLCIRCDHLECKGVCEDCHVRLCNGLLRKHTMIQRRCGHRLCMSCDSVILCRQIFCAFCRA